MTPELLIRSALIMIYVFLVCPFPETYLGRKIRRAIYVKTDPTYISGLHTAICAKFGLITSILIFKLKCTIYLVIAVGC